jgi:hypothetical protein
MVYVARKTSGAAVATALGIKLNTTVCSEAASASASGFNSTTTDRAENGMAWLRTAARLTNYHGSLIGHCQSKISSTGAYAHSNYPQGLFDTAPDPAVELTAIILRHICTGSGITGFADELHIYEFDIT